MIYREVRALQALGDEIFTISIRQPDASEVPSEAKDLYDKTIYVLPLSPHRILFAHINTFFRHPLRYWTVLTEVLTGTHDRFRDRLRTLCHFVEAVSVLPAVENLRPDHLHAHWAVGSATCAMVISRFLGIPFTFTAHAYDIWRDRLLLPEKLKAAKLVITCTDSNRRHLESTYGADIHKIKVVYHGVDEERLRPRLERRNSTPIILAVGRLVEQKGFDSLIRACAILSRKGYRFHCEIIGEGPLRAKLEGLARDLNLGHFITLRGQLSQEQLIEYYSKADLFVLPCVPARDQDRDGIPNTIIEAMAMEIPVISTNFSGIPELVLDRGTGLLVETNDVPQLADAMCRLLDDPDSCRRMGQAGRERILESFTIGASAKRLRETFLRVSE